jgi:transcriptional regulator with XRE-family HTH domain
MCFALAMPSPNALWHRWPYKVEVDAGLAEFGHELQISRRQLRMTQMQLERVSGVDQSMISRLERGQLYGVPRRRLVVLARGLDAVLGFVPRERREQTRRP